MEEEYFNRRVQGEGKERVSIFRNGEASKAGVSECS